MKRTEALEGIIRSMKIALAHGNLTDRQARQIDRSLFSLQKHLMFEQSVRKEEYIPRKQREQTYA